MRGVPPSTRRRAVSFASSTQIFSSSQAFSGISSAKPRKRVIAAWVCPLMSEGRAALLLPSMTLSALREDAGDISRMVPFSMNISVTDSVEQDVFDQDIHAAFLSMNVASILSIVRTLFATFAKISSIVRGALHVSRGSNCRPSIYWHTAIPISMARVASEARVMPTISPNLFSILISARVSSRGHGLNVCPAHAYRPGVHGAYFKDLPGKHLVHRRYHKAGSSSKNVSICQGQIKSSGITRVPGLIADLKTAHGIYCEYLLHPRSLSAAIFARGDPVRRQAGVAVALQEHPIT